MGFDEFRMDEEYAPKIDMGEIYRQNYLDALDEIRKLKQDNTDLKAENCMLRAIISENPKNVNS